MLDFDSSSVSVVVDGLKLEEEKSRETKKIIRIFAKKYCRKHHAFFNREDIECECLQKLAEYVKKNKHHKDSFLKSFTSAVQNHLNSLYKKHFKSKSRQEEVLFSELENSDGASLIDLTQEHQEIEDMFDLIVFKEQIAELKTMLTPLSIAILSQIVNPDPAFTELVLVQRSRKKHINETSGFTAYEKPKLIATLAEYFGETKSSIRTSIREIQEACQRIFPKWQSEFNFEL
jgi:hypothetical protein